MGCLRGLLEGTLISLQFARIYDECRHGAYDIGVEFFFVGIF